MNRAFVVAALYKGTLGYQNEAIPACSVALPAPAFDRKAMDGNGMAISGFLENRWQREAKTRVLYTTPIAGQKRPVLDELLFQIDEFGSGRLRHVIASLCITRRRNTFWAENGGTVFAEFGDWWRRPSPSRAASPRDPSISW